MADGVTCPMCRGINGCKVAATIDRVRELMDDGRDPLYLLAREAVKGLSYEELGRIMYEHPNPIYRAAHEQRQMIREGEA